MHKYKVVQFCVLFFSCRPSLSHQRPQEDKQKQLDGVSRWYKRGVDSSKTVTKFRKGACENCGSMTHKKKDCLEVCSFTFTGSKEFK